MNRYLTYTAMVSGGMVIRLSSEDIPDPSSSLSLSRAPAPCQGAAPWMAAGIRDALLGQKRGHTTRYHRGISQISIHMASGDGMG